MEIGIGIAGGVAGAFLLLGMSLPGCARARSEGSVLNRLAPPGASADLASTPRGGGAVAVVGGETLSWDDLRPAMVELAGARALEEAALGVLLRQECSRAAVVVREQDVAAERGLLLRTLSRTASVNDPEAERLLSELRERRGLGDARFAGLLERNAMLRALVRAEARASGGGEDRQSVSEDDVRRAYDLKYGPRVRARIMVLADSGSAERVRSRLQSESFETVARQESIDPSRSAGGLIEPVSVADTNQPEALRRALASLRPGEVSSVFPVTWEGTSQGTTMSGLAIVKHEGIDTRDDAPTLDSIRAELQDEIVTVRERAAMEKLARRLLGDRRGSEVRVLDGALGKAWDNRESAVGR